MTNADIHPTAVIDPTAKIDPSAVVGPYAVVGPRADIGPGCRIGAHAVLEFVRMGRGNKIHPGAYVGTPPQDLKYAGEETLLVMGDNCTVREGATLNRGTAASGKTVIGDNCLFMTCSHVAHDCRVGNNVILVNCVALAGHVEVGDFSIVGGFAGVHQFARIGRFCMIGAGAMVGKDMPSFCTCQGDRATLRGLNLLGMRRAGLHRDTVSAIKNAYKELFLSGTTTGEAIARIREGAPPEVLEIIAQIETSKRGITRPATGALAEEEVTV
ncbi:MAG: acyl-ACP--UDP-N-acetylglucosamine O-acyltransferase [Elusimicrobia bacterium]|nr:acyl-ACP--UDP-N-acetylglucosamine O-acyltransferase [Elusimicrobiota bacterium]